jgi:excisionase family DNA binding protein
MARNETSEDLVDVLTASGLVNRNPETLRRWIRSGRLAAFKQGRRFLVSRSDVEARGERGGRAGSLRSWADTVMATRGSRTTAARPTAADLVISDRRERRQGKIIRARR